MIPLAVPNLNGNEKKYLDDCIDSTFVSSVGPYVTRFEEMVAKATGSEYAVATSAGTTGLHAALTSVGVSAGDLVIVPTFTFIASANAVKHCGAIPWLMDIDDSTWCLNADFVRSEIDNNCKLNENGKLYHISTGRQVAALMPVYTLGNIPNMKAMRKLADDYNLPLVVDAACAIGATYESDDFGGMADLSVISFNGNKTITCGGGGAVVGNNKILLDEVRHITTTARVWPDYDFDEVGFNYRMTNIQAAVGVAQLERLEFFLVAKRHVREYYFERLHTYKSAYGIDFFPTTAGSGCWFSGIVLPYGTTYDSAKIMCDYLKKQGVEAKPFWKPVHLQKPYVDSPVSDTHVADGLWQRIITLPCSTTIEDSNLDVVVEKVIDALALYFKH
ncbi:MAG TPA: pyridoxal-5'-phosphate-dependent protein [Eubacterium sp.]|nr:pyridoxal-5'-phosphate-dependent protein [Eubacterium sp.]